MYSTSLTYRVFLLMIDTPVLEPGALFLFMLEELVELISVDSWRELWVYLETRSKRFTKVTPLTSPDETPR
jgi:THO complex subunit 1